jgi:hypothetical protein
MGLTSQVRATREGRARLRPNRGFPLDLARKAEPLQILARIIFAPASQRRILALRIFCLDIPRPRRSDQFERMLCAGSRRRRGRRGKPRLRRSFALPGPGLPLHLAREDHPRKFWLQLIRASQRRILALHIFCLKFLMGAQVVLIRPRSSLS